MALPAAIDLSTTFNLRTSTPKFNLINETVVSELGTLTSTIGNFKVVNPLNVTVYENTSAVTPDLKGFTISSITRSSTTATATTTASHGMVTGDWVLVKGAIQAEYNILAQITKINATVFTYQVAGSPTTPATTGSTFTCFRSSLNTVSIPTDSDTGLPIVGDYTITLTLTVAATPYEKEFEYDNQYVRPTVVISQSVDCFTPKYTSTDSTEYTVNDVDPTLDRTHTIIFPADADRSNQVGVAQTVYLYYPKVYNGFYQSRVSTNTIYEYTDDLIVWDTITGSQSFEVSCSVSGCDMKCCLNELNSTYESQITAGNTSEAAKTLVTLNRGLQLYNLFIVNIQCGDTTNASANVAAFWAATNCSSDCTCGDSTQVIPYNGIVGKTIQLYDSETAYGELDYIDFENDLYRVLENTSAGDNPTDNPDSFQIIGA